jgi:hypothetical protein
MESFFGLLQRNVLDRKRWSTRAELRSAIVTWIERIYHRRRRQRALGKLIPIEFELLQPPVATRGLKFTLRESTEPGAVPKSHTSDWMFNQQLRTDAHIVFEDEELSNLSVARWTIVA